MKKMVVFDPPMCCSSGVCGPVIDPTLPRFAADLSWLVGQGVVVERYNLSQQPQAFAMNENVRVALVQQGNSLSSFNLNERKGCEPRELPFT